MNKFKQLMNQKGWTWMELITVLGILGVIAFWGITVYVGWHFISKFW